jgi:hypothetical protein
MRSAYKTQFFPEVRDGRRGSASKLVLAYSSELPYKKANTLDICNYIASIAQEIDDIAKAIGHKDLACTLMVAATAARAEAQALLS